MTKPKVKLAEVIPMPPRPGDVAAMLRKMADEVEAGDLGDNVKVAMAVSGDSFEVRGFGKIDGMEAIALLNLGLAYMVNETLEEMEP